MFPFLAPLLVLVWDRLRPHLTISRHTKATITQVSKNLTRVDVSLPPQATYSPGDWANILFPALEKYNWHPFSVYSLHSETPSSAVFYIRHVGAWSKNVSQLARKSPASKYAVAFEVPMKFDGFFGEHPNSLPGWIHHQHVVFVAGGSGMAALRPLISQFVSNNPTSRVTIIWAVKHQDDISAFPELVMDLSRWSKTQSTLKTYFYVTQSSSSVVGHDVVVEDLNKTIEIFNNHAKFSPFVNASSEAEYLKASDIFNHHIGSAAVDFSKIRIATFAIALLSFIAGFGGFVVGRIVFWEKNEEECFSEAMLTNANVSHFNQNLLFFFSSFQTLSCTYLSHLLFSY
jgi:NAD(P)H-flavin reductase